MEDTLSTYSPSDEVPGIDHHGSGVSYCNRCDYRLILMSDDDGDGGEIRDMHTYADCDSNRGVDVHTWADAYGLWHARVTVSREYYSDVTPRMMALSYIVDEIAQRESTSRGDIRVRLASAVPETVGNATAYHFSEPRRDVDPAQRLTDIMEFDHVIQVHDDGSITECPDIYAPDLHDGEIESPDWSFMDGYSGQYRYSGPIMHPSEFIGGQMERDIRETPGVYVSLVNYPLCGEDCEDCGGDGCEPDGWAVATRDVDV